MHSAIWPPPNVHLWGRIGDSDAMKLRPRHRVGHSINLAGAGMIRAGVIGVS